MKKEKSFLSTVLLFVFGCGVAAFAADFPGELRKALLDVGLGADMVVAVKKPAPAEDESVSPQFVLYVQDELKSALSEMRKTPVDSEISGITSDGELSTMYVENGTMVQVLLVYRRYMGNAAASVFTVSTEGVPGLTYNATEDDRTRRRLSAQLGGTTPEDAIALCRRITSLENDKKSALQEYGNRILERQHSLESWYRAEKARIDGAKRDPWQSEADFRESQSEAFAELNAKRTRQESAFMTEAASDTGGLRAMEIQSELEAYYALLADTRFTIRSNGCTVLDFDVEAKEFPVKVSVAYPQGDPQFLYAKTVRCQLFKPGEVLSNEEKGKRYWAFDGKTLTAELVYRVSPDPANDGVFENQVQRLCLKDSATGDVLYEEEEHGSAGKFNPSVASDFVPVTLSVVSSPSGAAIYVDGEPKGKAPLVIKDMRPGLRTVEAVWGDGTTSSKTVDVFRGMNTSRSFRKGE